jgi:glyoxylase-like metal-dependent hydrolase (beta-lactamase superfamily II)
LPAGKEPLESLAWQEIHGAPGAQIYPLIRKIDTLSSNSYLIATPDTLILIDPGGLVPQVESLSVVIGESRTESELPVFAFLTHAHIDHFIGVQGVPAFAHSDAVVFAVQETGARALESGDTKLTQSSLLQTPVAPMKIGLYLLTEERSRMHGVPASLCFPNGAEISIVQDLFGGKISDGIPRERITFGPGPVLEVYHTPGHSPDSICLRMGDLLFIGDLLFAASPGIAGLIGWSQQDLLRSLDAISDLIATGGIRLVCPGHGRAITAPDAARMLAMVKRDALALDGIAELNQERAAQTAAFAEDCMEEINELFTIMAGRLQYAAYVMDELGEIGMAEEANALIRGDTIDELLETFQSFASAHHQCGKVPIHLVLKAGQVIGKLERTFNRDELSGIIDPTMVGRANRLLSDYTTMLRGFAPPGEISCHDLVSVAGAVVTGLSVPPCSDEDVLESLGDDAEFSKILLARIGARPLLEEVEMTTRFEPAALPAWVDRDHFSDLLTYILEDLVGTGATSVELTIRQEADQGVVSVAGRVPDTAGVREQRTRRFLQCLAGRAGGTLELVEKDGVRTFVFAAPASSATTPGPLP